MTTDAKKPAFKYSAEDFDSDAATARSAAYREVREAVKDGEGKNGLPTDKDGSLTDEAKAMHNAAALAARTAVNALIKAAEGRKARESWSDEETVKAHRWLCQEGVKVYRSALAAQGFTAPDTITATAAKAFEAKMVEGRAKREVAAKVSGTNADALDSIFGS